jgi:hypothetical protein
MSRSKKFLEDICRLVGHDLNDIDVCNRCGDIILKRLETFKIGEKPKCKYEDLVVRKYDVLDRMRFRMSDSLRLAEEKALLDLFNPPKE